MKKIILFIFLAALMQQSIAQTGPCVGSASITANPPPDSTTGCYGGGVTVTFCVSITDYAQSGIDWICGVTPTLGPGWDLATLVPVSPSPSCDGQGVWAWFPSCTSLPPGSGLTWGPGFYYDSPANSPTGTIDGIAGNNFGDNCANFTWNFCFQVTTLTNLPAFTSTAVTVDIYSDYMAGNWGTDACQGDNVGDSMCINPNCTVTLPILNTTNVTCFDDTTGTAFAQGAGGYPPYTYLWSTGQTGQSISGLTAGIYSVTITDSIGCMKNVFYNILGPPEIIDNATITSLGCDSLGMGSIVTNITGGIAPYSYLWNIGSTTSSLINIPAGTYTLTITDSIGCVKTYSYMINSFAPVIFTIASTSAMCGLANGTATITVSSGSAPYTYTWTPPVSTGSTATGLSAGTYYITVTDSNGCSKTDSVVVGAIATFTLSTSATTANCAGTGGSASVVVTGSSGPLTYLWSPSGGNGPVATNLNAGTYTVLVTDTNNCSLTATVNVPQMTSTVLVSITGNPPGCDTSAVGVLTAVPAGGTAPYTYLWSPIGGTGQTATNLPSGTYTVLVTDSNQCTATGTAVIAPVIPVTYISATTNALCNTSNTGSATITTTSGGVPPYSYLWSNGSTSTTITGVSPGTYTFTITDSNGCTSTGTAIVGQNPAVFVTVNPDTTICSGQVANLSANGSGGTPVFNYSWSNGVFTSSQQVNPASTTTYIVTITDGTMCTATASVTVTVVQYPVISLTADATICEGTSIALNASGGNTYSWSPSTGLNNSNIDNPVATPASTTNYIVTANNGNCSSTDSVLITVVPSPVASFTADTTQGATVSFTNTSTGGVSYLWYFGDGTSSTATDPIHTFTTAGSYTVTLVVTNSLGCTDTFLLVIENFSSLNVPNIFTPNADNYNDVFQLTEYGLKSINVEIYNRWGLKIYEWDKLNGQWDGRTLNGDEAPDGTYFYIIKAKGGDAKDYNLKGTVTLIRNNIK